MRWAIVLAAALVAVGCGSREKPSVATARTAPKKPARVLPKLKGSAAATGGEQTDVSVTAAGDYVIYFTDAEGDVPAARLSAVSLEVEGRKVPLEINDTGETWVGKGPVPAAPSAVAKVQFSRAGKTSSAEVPLAAANLPLDYVCPMDPDIRSSSPGKCSRCGMTLVPGIPDPEEYPLELKITPADFKPGQKVRLFFTARDPKTGKPATKFEQVHERLFHLFIVSADMKYFVHDHPELSGGVFEFTTVFPHPGMYRLLGDFYPAGGTPQLAPMTVFVPGAPDAPVSLEEAKLTPDTSSQTGRNTQVNVTIDPPHPVAGESVRLVFTLNPGDGLEKYLGAWAHMLAASDDLIDLLHEHPVSTNGGPEIEFNLVLPRPRTYRLWMQFQRKGVVNTIAVNVPAR